MKKGRALSKARPVRRAGELTLSTLAVLTARLLREALQLYPFFGLHSHRFAI
jgi:hypothetical protein